MTKFWSFTFLLMKVHRKLIIDENPKFSNIQFCFSHFFLKKRHHQRLRNGSKDFEHSICENFHRIFWIRGHLYESRNGIKKWNKTISWSSLYLDFFQLGQDNYSSRHLLVEIQQWKHQKNVWNLFKVNNIDARMTSLKSFGCLYG